MTLPLPYITRILAFDGEIDSDNYLASHEIAIYTNPFLPDIGPKPKLPAWKPLPPPKPTPLADRIWNAKASASAVVKGVDSLRVVDLKGQVT
jgi:hypothetical protein